MGAPVIESPASGSRIVSDDSASILIGQPPDIVKGLLRQGFTRFDTLVLPDTREIDGSLLNNLEFPLYSFLFISRGLAEGRRLNLVGDRAALSQSLRLLRLTLTGPTRMELEAWGCDDELLSEWLAVSRELALKHGDGTVMPVDEFFNLAPFSDNRVVVGGFTIERLAANEYRVANSDGEARVNLNEDRRISPPYPVVTDYLPGGLQKFGIEVLGGASGFSTTEPCTGLVMCFNGNYILIDSLPFLNQHLAARGISKNQVVALFLTHIHDDHCSMFPLLEMPHRVEVITTRAIFHMAMDKLACGLGWKREVIEQHFKLVEVTPGETINYFGLNIETHNTVHSIPTIGATFRVNHHGISRDVCIVGDNQSMTKIRQMAKTGLVRPSTIANLERLYRQKFHLLIADGGEGDIHGDPNDALESQSERVVFVHVDDVPEALKTTFSVVSSGKRYTLFEGDSAIDTARIHHHLTDWLGQPLPNRWLNNLLVEQEIYRYNNEDVIIVEGSSASDSVYLLLTGYCDVIRIEKGERKTVARLQAGDIIGEMATLTGSGVRNASVVATSPVTVCVFDGETFRNFILHSGFQEQLENRWKLRPLIKRLPQFSSLASMVIDRVVQYCEHVALAPGDELVTDEEHQYFLVQGEAASQAGERRLTTADESGWRPFAPSRVERIKAKTPCDFIRIRSHDLTTLMDRVPQINYQTRKRYAAQPALEHDWIMGKVTLE